MDAARPTTTIHFWSASAVNTWGHVHRRRRFQFSHFSLRVRQQKIFAGETLLSYMCTIHFVFVNIFSSLCDRLLGCWTAASCLLCVFTLKKKNNKLFRSSWKSRKNVCPLFAANVSACVCVRCYATGARPTRDAMAIVRDLMMQYM